MKASELRIGNSIMQDDDFVFVTWWRLELMENNKIEYKPIPLTEEWLLKLGFDKSNIYSFGNHKLIIEFTMGNRYSCRYRINPDESIRIAELHYVHQLQNLYHSLTDEELTIKDEVY